jgi:putative Mg2+ transporter-C (MgtC) family protein
MIETGEVLLRLALGAVFGGAIGYERQVHGRPAGFRTHMLVCISSVLIMEVSEYFHHLSVMDPSYVRVDPGRIAAGAITGVGFLGAGVIIKMGATVHGLTTAACLWMVSAIGLALGTGMYIPSTAAFALTLFALLVLRVVERHSPKSAFRFLTVNCRLGTGDNEVRATLRSRGVDLYNAEYESDKSSEESTLRYTVTLKKESDARPLVDELMGLEGVRRVHIRS